MSLTKHRQTDTQTLIRVPMHAYKYKQAYTEIQTDTCEPKLQALVYDILPSTTAVFSYAIGPRKLSANEQFFCWCSNSSTFVTNNSNYIRRVFYNYVF